MMLVTGGLLVAAVAVTVAREQARKSAGNTGIEHCSFQQEFG